MLRILLVVLTLTFMCLVAAKDVVSNKTATSELAEKYYDQSYKYYVNRDYDKAEVSIKKALEIDNDNYVYHIRMVHLLVLHDDKTIFMNYFERLCSSFIKADEVERRSICLRDYGKLLIDIDEDKALKVYLDSYELVMSLDGPIPDDLNKWFVPITKLLQYQLRFSDAINFCEKMLREVPSTHLLYEAILGRIKTLKGYRETYGDFDNLK